ncbi:hypothetical protein BH09BAC3_BH09BAC3_15820 [soil metagenome]
MRDLVNVLQGVFTREFYRLNVMFFLLVCGLAFGFMSGVEHKALAEFLTSGPVMTLIPVSLWILYGVKIYSFNNQVCRMREMTFVRLLALTSTRIQFFCSISVVANQFLPAIGYGAFLIIIAIQNQSLTAAFCIGISLFLLVLTFSILLYRRINSIEEESRASLLKKWMDKNFEKSFIQFFVEWLMRNHPGIIVFTKIFGCVLLLSVCQLYKYDEYDYRLLALGCLASFGVSIVMAHHYVLFENHKFQVLRNLPINLTRRMLYFALSITFLCLPEFIVLVRNFPNQLAAYHFIEVTAFVISNLILGYVILLKIKNNLERFSGNVFILSMMMVVIILFGVPLYLISVVALGVSILLYQRGYYEFETEEAST